MTDAAIKGFILRISRKYTNAEYRASVAVQRWIGTHQIVTVALSIVALAASASVLVPAFIHDFLS